MAYYGGSEDWHSSREFLEKLERFHDRYARYPDMSAAKRVQGKFLNTLGDEMKRLCRWRIREYHYAGSVYENLKIGQPDEFDIMVIIEDRNLQVKQSSKGGFYYLSPGYQSDGQWSKVLDHSGNVSSSKMRSEFYSIVTRAIQNCDFTQMGAKLKQRAHGPAVQVDLQIEVPSEGFMFSIDLVPTLDVNGSLYVAKPFPGDQTSWRICTSLREKQKLDGMDRDNGCRKKSVRILKAIRQQEAKFQTLASYHYKTSMFHVSDRQQDWRQQHLGQRLMDILAFVQTSLEHRRLPHYFHPDINLLDTVSDTACQDLAYRIQRLRKSKTEFFRLLE